MSLCSSWVTPSDVKGWPEAICDEADQQLLLDAASEVLYARSGHQWPGVCEVTVRPCGVGSIGYPEGSWWDLSGIDRWTSSPWPWRWDPCCGIGRSCACSRQRRLDLPGGPIVSVLDITIDGISIDPATYRVAPPRTLIRMDGSWPCSQNLAATLDEPGTFSVTYEYGAEPPKAGILAARALALELAKASCGDRTCQLPARVTELSRQSTTVTIESITSLLSEGLTGVAAVDLFVSSLNPTRATRSGRVRNPDRPTRFDVETLGSS